MDATHSYATPGHAPLASGAGTGARAETGAVRPYQVVSALGVDVAYNDDGQGEPVVCLHAIGHGARDFEAFRRAVSPHFRVIALDWPGHGRSASDTEAPSVTRYAQVLEAFLDAIGVERATLVGNSIGGGAAIRFTADSPGRVRALVLENPAGLEPLDLVAKGAIGSMARLCEAGANGAPWFCAAFAAYYRAVLPSEPARAQRARIVASALEIAPLLADAWASFADESQDLRQLGSRISRPTLFAWASRDRFVHLWRNRPAISEYVNARIEEFPAGHSPHLETPDAFMAAFLRFMREVREVETLEEEK